MPARDVQTNLTIALQTRGFDKGLRDVLGMSQKSVDSLKKQALAGGKVQEQMDRMQKKVQDLAKVQLEASQALEKIADKTGAAYRYQEERMEKARRETEKLRKETQLLERAHQGDVRAQKQMADATERLIQIREKERRAGRWAGAQGFMQGAGMGGMAGMFMQRGPGFWRQFAGQQVGGMLRRAGGAAQGMAFGGIQGLQTALQAIPGGGVVAGQLGAVASHSQRALQWQRERLSLSPMFGGNMGQIAMGRREQREAQAGLIDLGKQSAHDSRIQRRHQAYFKGRDEAAHAMKMTGLQFLPGGESMLKDVSEEVGMMALRREKAKDIEAAETLREQRTRGTRRARRAEMTPFLRAGQIGRRLAGLGRQESAQRIGQLMQTAGGRFTGEAGQVGDVSAALAAQTMFGVGPEAAGGFMAAGRRGGLVGGRGRAGEALTEALQGALEMGLEGAEITRYMQQVAQGIQQFQMTGIPFNKDSIKSMTLEMGKAGIGGVRGGAMAGGLQRYVQGIGQRGITGGLDLMMMQAFGGFKGGGAQDFEQAILQMESMQGMGPGGIEAGGPMGNMIKRLVGMGGGARGGGVTFMRKALGRAGMQMSMGEAMALTERITGEQLLSPEQREAFGIDKAGEAARMGAGKTQAGKIATVDQLVAAAAKRVTDMGPNLRKQASIMDKQLEVGSKALTAVQNLEQSSLALNDTFMFLAGDTLKNFSEGMKDVTAELGKLTKEHGLLTAIRKMTIGI